ncbi:hypothetical protein CCL45_gp52 [Sulfolobus islandicus rod-shaped virus 5]|uniref:Uncharacterized protein n=4 Tax=Usarudivirus TaxID=2843109 RepID=A0A1X9SKN8_9VIRU|nr:hypothetical protein CCL45_gp52 [Sulfolobus islandicus rod-shaped virus 5]YP_009362780.1 hypothetical protein CCL47_gp46 [Sulfolobus islandicus rod-shaped virus 11]YP_009362913.1 hypothetical protein CCL44_gp51 [Sulfolobus islandicus rod-shaped phage 6]YP_009362968.1 hypothetical protein CCL46_gp50 [Sulfolobus islandicus rod-shaped virus 4]ARQ96566.1 hypothetical protein [Sulfolobus islandicus rod-shaped virus 4]ARQ96674.1 hypothetical protein [Sulfolobus islandicus rod-shaped virus 5]ARQ9
MSENKLINEIINSLEVLKQQIDEIKTKLISTNHDKDIENVFEKLRKIADDHLINGIIFVSNSEVKYVAIRSDSTGYKTLVILNNKAYYFYEYSIIKGRLQLRYFKEYDIPEDIIKILEKLPESNIDYAEPRYFKLYYILKKHYPIDLIKE